MIATNKLLRRFSKPARGAKAPSFPSSLRFNLIRQRKLPQLIRVLESAAQSPTMPTPAPHAAPRSMSAAKEYSRVEDSVPACAVRSRHAGQRRPAVLLPSSVPRPAAGASSRWRSPSALPPIYFPTRAPYLHFTGACKFSYHDRPHLITIATSLTGVSSHARLANPFLRH
jgi:hypothetical protein